MTTSEAIQLIGVIAAFLAAMGAFWAAYVGLRNARVAENAALLGSIPLPVPWVDLDETSIKLKNRGKTDAHELKWTLLIGGKKVGNGQISKVIPAGCSERLTREQNAIVAKALTAKDFAIRCHYMTSWGDYLTLERTYVDSKSQGIKVFDNENKRLTLRGAT